MSKKTVVVTGTITADIQVSASTTLEAIEEAKQAFHSKTQAGFMLTGASIDFVNFDLDPADFA